MPFHPSLIHGFLIGTGLSVLLFFTYFFSVTGPSASHLLKLAEAPPSAEPKLPSLLDVHNATLGFQKIFVISLPSRSDQRDLMSLAATYSNIEIEYIDGVTEVDPKALPPGNDEVNMNSGSLGAWRAHMNVARHIVEHNLSSALILEGDVDWDLRIKAQLEQFAKASQVLLQPLKNATDEYVDPSYPQPSESATAQDFDARGLYSAVTEPSSSPYGDLDRWDILWLGHCGCRFPNAGDKQVPIGRAVLWDDETTPKKQHLDMELGDQQLIYQYPEHTRVVSRAWMNSCTLAYGLSQQGARSLLYELGVRAITGTNDMMFRSICHGSDGRALRTCLTVQPQLFQHHRSAGPRSRWSDINGGDDVNERAYTQNIRLSTKINLAKLVAGETDYFDSDAT